MNYISEVIGAWYRNSVARFFKRLAIALVLLYFGIAAIGHYSTSRCTAAEKALSKAPAFAGPIDEADAVAHPEKLQYAREQIRAIQKCGW